MEQTADLLKEMELNFAKLRKDLPNQMAGWYSLRDAVRASGALDVKTKELIALAISVTAHCDWCVAAHTKYALGNGATKEEVMEASWVAVQMGGGPSLAYLQVVQKALADLST